MSGTSWWQRLTLSKGPSAGASDAGKRKASHQGAAKTGRSTAKTARSGAARPSGGPGRPARIDPALPVMGVDACKVGWVGAVLDPSGTGTPILVVSDTIDNLVSQVGKVTVVGVDIPIGLPDDSRREADVQTRKFLVGKASSVFTTPVREAVYAATYGEANAINRDKVGAGVSKQAYELRRKIIEVDRYLRQNLDFVLVEVHPEASLAELTGQPVASRKRTAEGAKERREALAAAGIYVPTTAPVGVATDDMIDACAAAWTAHRVKLGVASRFPAQPETFSDGIDAAIHH
ncbi:MAG: DUF429 domain-containing protein [Ornithinimicrobium sp.]|uniref:DUF429 domain-containing protein n=1 Tax=Ornithinimicrobium sp. TaxID=1977084 RepID=UPI0026E0CDA8|nr:DUF429 domain-containing protein [Ornithinimicrobium sp.]MDO5741056.1 DUF429 domain-containing protein [Ornithinimicrobium sp.]